MSLERLQSMIEAVNASNSANAKKLALADFSDLKPLLALIYHPLVTFGVSEAGQKKAVAKIGTKRIKLNTCDSLLELLEGLKDRLWTGHTAASMIEAFTEANPTHRDLIGRILERDLQIGMNVTQINAVWPKLIPKFDVALAEKYEERIDKVDFAEDWYYSRKLDGCRCVVLIDHTGEPRFYSRTGNEFLQLANAVPEIKKLNLVNTALDSEVCIMNNGSEDFAQVNSQLKRKNFTIANPQLQLFDMMPLDGFLAGEHSELFSQRQAKLGEIFKRYDGNGLVHLKQTRVESKDKLAEAADDAVAKGWEGLIIRRDGPYKSGRSNNILKVKKFQEAEFTVIGIKEGTKQMLKNGKKVNIKTLGAVTVRFDENNTVDVGSGFSDEERQQIFANPASIIGKQITVQYFEETENSKGGKSMRFPTKKAIWWQDRDI